MPSRLLAAGLAMVLSPATAFAETAQIAAVSGRDHLALHDLATGAELNRFDAPGGSSDLVAPPSGVVLSNHTGGHQVILIDLKRRAEIGRIPSSALGGTRPVHMYLSQGSTGGSTSSCSTTAKRARRNLASGRGICRCS